MLPDQLLCLSFPGEDGGGFDLAFTVGIITVAAAFCVISVVSLCHCVRHVLAGATGKAAPLNTLFFTEDEVEMAELRHFPLPHTGQVGSDSRRRFPLPYTGQVSPDSLRHFPVPHTGQVGSDSPRHFPLPHTEQVSPDSLRRIQGTLDRKVPE